MPHRTAMLCSFVLLMAACRPSVDVARETQELLERDRAWAQIAATGTNADSVLSFWTEDARVVLPGQAALEGKAAIREMVTNSMAIPGFHVTWTPETAVVSQAGDLAYTFGTNEFTVPDSTGTLTTSTGRYLTVWRKEPDGRWRCVLDYSSPGPAGEPSAR